MAHRRRARTKQLTTRDSDLRSRSHILCVALLFILFYGQKKKKKKICTNNAL